MKKRILFSLMGLILCATTWAQMPEKGKFYRIKNASYGSVMNENWGVGTVNCVGQNEDYNQLWQYTEQGALQNVYTGKYIQNQPYNSQIFTTGTNVQVVSFTQQSDGHLGINTNGNQMHCNAGRDVVRWQDNANEGNHWIVEEVALTQAEVDAARAEYNNLTNLIQNSAKFTTALRTFFTSDLCTELKTDYAAMDDAALKAAMAKAGLPVMIQDIAVKVKNQWWNDTDKTTYADKNKYAKDFRVATYKPYSDANNWRDKMNTYAPSFMGNPTGIYATNKDVIHVFVGNDIPANATLYLTPIRNHGRIGSRTEGTQLKKGYNAVVTTTDSVVYFINYVVNTIPTSNVNAHTKTIAKISDFSDLNIHIEGGQCVGYYQKPAENSAEEDAKYQYLTKNANDGMYFMVKGATSLFYFKKYTYTKHFANTIWNSINWFDRLHFWEFAIIGVMDDVANGKCENGTEYSKAAYPLNIKGGDAFYPTYCNNPTMAMEGPDGQNPHATTFYTSYPGPGSCESSFNAERENFDNWCAGHEHGHQIQAPYNLESCSESSVNLPSNIITYLSGFRLGRGWNFEQNYAYVADNVVFGARDISITMRMYYNLFLYYHIGGKKKDFYPTFVKSLREDPMDFSRDGVQYSHPEWGAPSGGHHRATKTWIKFYKKACEAAQEDLTEYFRLWGFFVPCDKLYLGDYTSYAVSLTQKEIDDAIAEVKSKGYPENLQIMFVEDRQIPRERTDIWAKDATGDRRFKPTNWEAWYTEEQLKAEYGDVGDILTYIDGSANTSEYIYVRSANKIYMKGHGGVGFIVYDKDGNSIYMSNRFNFTIPNEASKEEITIKVINADGTSSTATEAPEQATDDEKLAILQGAIYSAKQYTILTDPEGTKVGFYKSEELSTLIGYVDNAESAIETEKTGEYLTLANNINNEVIRVQTEFEPRSITTNGLYRITSFRDQTKYLYTTTRSTAIQASTSKNDNTLWSFVPVGENEPNKYYLQNLATGKMAGATLNEKGDVTQVKMVEADPADACIFRVNDLGTGKFGLRPNDNTYLNISPDGGITIWYGADEGSQWYITLADEIEPVTEESAEELIAMTEDLINDICTYSITQTEKKLQTTDENAAGYLSTNQPSTNSSNQIEKAIDNSERSHFQSDDSGNAEEAHHLLVNLGEKIGNIQFYISGAPAQRYATQMRVYVSNNKTAWKLLASTYNMSEKYTSHLIRSTTKYQYWKFEVISTDGKAEDTSTFPWFTVREFKMYEATENFDWNPGFESFSKTGITNCKDYSINLSNELSKEFRTQINDRIAYNNLLDAYNSLYKAASKIDPTVDINDIQGTEENTDKVIYDLSGRKVNNANAKGVFIVGGKVVVK